jgi:hypothetical protein
MTAVMKRVAKRRNIAAMLERILGLAIKKTCETHGWQGVWLEPSNPFSLLGLNSR